ncbi:hypothetical protein BX600DRAFT_472207 [Xylariales sp. PMI_506]|nr:hypothetical protein BX600DRAFT_472207 [Xylariales sp. PMI_506]
MSTTSIEATFNVDRARDCGLDLPGIGAQFHTIRIDLNNEATSQQIDLTQLNQQVDALSCEDELIVANENSPGIHLNPTWTVDDPMQGVTQVIHESNVRASGGSRLNIASLEMWSTAVHLNLAPNESNTSLQHLAASGSHLDSSVALSNSRDGDASHALHASVIADAGTGNDDNGVLKSSGMHSSSSLEVPPSPEPAEPEALLGKSQMYELRQDMTSSPARLSLPDLQATENESERVLRKSTTI